MNPAETCGGEGHLGWSSGGATDEAASDRQPWMLIAARTYIATHSVRLNGYQQSKAEHPYPIQPHLVPKRMRNNRTALLYCRRRLTPTAQKPRQPPQRGRCWKCTYLRPPSIRCYFNNPVAQASNWFMSLVHHRTGSYLTVCGCAPFPNNCASTGTFVHKRDFPTLPSF